MKRIRANLKRVFACILPLLSLAAPGDASTRTLESRFSLSSDVRSEFRTQFLVPSAGRILVEASWESRNAPRAASSLSLVLIQPDGAVARQTSGPSTLRLEYVASEHDVTAPQSSAARWSVKIINDAERARTEVTGTLRITIPVSSRTLEDSQFTLLGSGNAQEIPVNVPDSGRIVVDVTWVSDSAEKSTASVPLVVSLIHPGEARTYARRQGSSPIEIDQQITEAALDRGGRWVVRLENDSQTKVKGRATVTYSPSL
jgi:hypothetical protein